MSIGWFLIINGIIGAILYIPVVVLFQKWCYKKFGEKVSEDALNDTFIENEMIIDSLANNDDKKISLLKAFNWMETIFLWEYKLPFACYWIYTNAKANSKNNEGP